MISNYEEFSQAEEIESRSLDEETFRDFDQSSLDPSPNKNDLNLDVIGSRLLKRLGVFGISVLCFLTHAIALGIGSRPRVSRLVNEQAAMVSTVDSGEWSSHLKKKDTELLTSSDQVVAAFTKNVQDIVETAMVNATINLFKRL